MMDIPGNRLSPPNVGPFHWRLMMLLLKLASHSFPLELLNPVKLLIRSEFEVRQKKDSNSRIRHAGTLLL